MKISYHYNHFHCNFSIIFNIWLGVDIWVRLVITSPQLLSGDVLLFYVSFSLLLLLLFLLLLLHHPDCCRVMYYYSTFLFHYYYYSYYFCQLCFSEMPRSNFMKPCRNIICHVKLCIKGLIVSKWLPLPWKWPKC